MRIISGINYYYKIDEMIKECLLKAKEHPFTQFLFIVEDKEMIEQRFFQYTDYFINIEIMTWKEYLKLLQIKHHLNHYKVLNQVELTYHLLSLFKTNHYHCFHTDHYYSLIKELCTFIKEIELNETIYQPNDYLQYPKLVDFMNIYQGLKERIGEDSFLTLESLLSHFSLKEEKQFLYIEADHLNESLRQNLITKLSQYHDITLMYTYQHDQRLFNLPFQNKKEDQCIDQSNFLLDHLFLQTDDKYHGDHDIYTFKASSPLQEVKRVVYTILQMIIEQNLKYEDFMIIYPDESYVDYLLQVLNQRHIPHNLKEVSLCYYEKDYQFILKQIDNLDFQYLSEYASYFLNENLENNYIDYFQSLTSFDMKMSNDEFKEFFTSTYRFHKQERNKKKDVIHITSIENAKTATKKHIFVLGMNETIFPTRIKDTGLLLDEDILLLRQHHISTPFTSLERLGMIYNDILKAFSCPYLSLTLSYSLTTLSNETRLPSSLYKQFEKMYDLKPLVKNKYLPIDDYYLTGAKYKQKKILNDHIDSYQKSKNQPVMIDQKIIKNIYNPTLSVSQIETYNKCPYLYFIQYGLNIYPLKDQELKPNELGSLVHYILSVNLDKDKDIDDLVHYYLSKNEILKQKIESSSINQYFIEQLKKDIDITLDVLKTINEQSLFEIHSLEEKVEDTIHELHFKGFVDRVDIYNNTISIIDYKSSSKDIDLNLVMQGFNIQMLLYLKMMTKKYQKDPGAVLYFNTKRRVLSSSLSLYERLNEDDFYHLYRMGGYVIDEEGDIIKAIDPQMDRKSNIINVNYVKKDNKYKGHVLTKKQLDKLFEEIENHIYKLYSNMILGDIGIKPKGSEDSSTHAKVNPCRYCDYRQVCHYDIFYNEYQMVQFYDVEKILKGE